MLTYILGVNNIPVGGCNSERYYHPIDMIIIIIIIIISSAQNFVSYQILKIREKILHICFVESNYSVYAVGFWLVKANVWIWQKKSVEPVLFGCF
jgi:hypothetical protein